MIRFLFAVAVAFAPAVAAEKLPPPRLFEANSADYEFSFGYPSEAVQIAKLKSIFEKELKKRQAELIKSAKEAKADALKNDYPYNAYQAGTAWETAADTAQILSLSGFFSGYSGGAHGNYGFASRVWDKKKGKLLKTSTDVFAKPAETLATMRKAYCEGLNAERRKKLGADWPSVDDGVFSNCPEFAELAIVFRADPGKAINRIAFVAAPYVAGSYVEGEYEVELPMTEALVAAIRPEYRGAFAAK
jgi:hypothetical protein